MKKSKEVQSVWLLRQRFMIENRNLFELIPHPKAQSQELATAGFMDIGKKNLIDGDVCEGMRDFDAIK